LNPSGAPAALGSTDSQSQRKLNKLSYSVSYNSYSVKAALVAGKLQRVPGLSPSDPPENCRSELNDAGISCCLNHLNCKLDTQIPSRSVSIRSHTIH
jgi:hypothetical protein